MSSVLQVENINVYYGSIHAVKDVSFHVEQGEVVTLIGANGAGKSTTLNTVAGLLRSRTGSVRFMDEELRHVPSHKLVGRGMALVPEGRRIFQHMTVQENLDMGGYCRSGDLNADIESVYERFPRLKERRKQVAGTLSGGEQQMLAMGRALMSHPKLLMLDEPSMGLAPILVEQIFDIIKNLHKAGTTILLVEHPPVYTLGKSGHAENLLVGREALEAMGAQFFHIDRGGDITFHGPGQLVCYPILDLERLGIGLRAYIDALEESVIRTVAEYGIRAERIAGASGVWVGAGIAQEGDHRTADGGGKCTPAGAPRKICAIGVRSSRYITMHGFALNVTTDLEWFSRINPCGFTDRGVTSIAAETGSQPSIQEVKQLVIRELATALQCEITSGS